MPVVEQEGNKWRCWGQLRVVSASAISGLLLSEGESDVDKVCRIQAVRYHYIY